MLQEENHIKRFMVFRLMNIGAGLSLLFAPINVMTAERGKDAEESHGTTSIYS
jgi:hypothetical protein